MIFFRGETELSRKEDQLGGTATTTKGKKAAERELGIRPRAKPLNAKEYGSDERGRED